jgi:hypothetical protein
VREPDEQDRPARIIADFVDCLGFDLNHYQAKRTERRAAPLGKFAANRDRSQRGEWTGIKSASVGPERRLDSVAHRGGT